MPGFEKALPHVFEPRNKCFKVCAALLEIYTLPPVDDTKPRVDMCFDDFDPKTMSRNEYAHARASASCSWARSWRWFFAKLEELKGQKEL
ncbi:unnamed protein product [Durusdinium trenchii]|uniref:Uncharacterized protein n=1 Tax=Durusdinium trenchii TaxID=1381693 RepID=A0ABP0P764_9DINO